MKVLDPFFRVCVEEMDPVGQLLRRDLVLSRGRGVHHLGDVLVGDHLGGDDRPTRVQGRRWRGREGASSARAGGARGR